ncbi:hypothetical protein UR09_02955 [Candidatus Nitromaritima sp. SCGC AAA799-A02]|nr:hypothetical protein UR09_02955 [Candidatus Nitromaritima sp. SCGC AAA799-A02]
MIFGAWGCQRISPQDLQEAINPINDKNYPLAIRKLSRLLLSDSQHPKVNYFLGYAYLKNKDHLKALAFINQALVADRGYEAVVGDTTMANFLAGNSMASSDLYFGLARLELEKIKSNNPNTEISDRIQHHLAYYFIPLKEYEKAIVEFEKVLSAPPHDTKYDQDSLLSIIEIYAGNLKKELEGKKYFKQFMDRYSESPKAAQALYVMAEYNYDKMKIYQKRSKSLLNFSKRWKGDQSLGPEAEMAWKQAQEDQQLANDYKTQAVIGYKKILSDYKQTRFHSLANLKLSEF